MQLTIATIDRDIVVAVKPHGLSTQSPPGTDSLQSRLQSQLGQPDGYLTPVHRLDRDTAGLVLFARTKKSARLLSEQFATRRVCKRYDATVRCGVGGPQVGGRWEDFVAKIADVARVRIAAADDPDAKRCQTDVQWVRFDAAAGTADLQLSPLTGRMHQLRIQCAARGFPIVGDRLYGPAGADDANVPMALVATHLTFWHPRTGVRTEVDVAAVAGRRTDRLCQ